MNVNQIRQDIPKISSLIRQSQSERGGFVVLGFLIISYSHIKMQEYQYLVVATKKKRPHLTLLNTGMRQTQHTNNPFVSNKCSSPTLKVTPPRTFYTSSTACKELPTGIWMGSDIHQRPNRGTLCVFVSSLASILVGLT